MSVTCATFTGRRQLTGVDHAPAMQPDSALSQARRRAEIRSGGPARLRVAVVTESFLPTGNRVTAGVCRTLEHLSRRGHDAVVICPGPAPESFAGAPVITVPSFSYRRASVGLPSSRVIRTLAAFSPDVVHLASPFVLGSAGVTAAERLGVPSVAIYQPGGDRDGGAQAPTGALAWRWIRRVHEQADLTLAPSTPALDALRAHAVPRLRLWGPDVDGEVFTPRRRGTEAVTALRSELAPAGEVLVGHAGRLASPAARDRLTALAGLPGVRVVVLGADPLARQPGLGHLDPRDDLELADAYAALDVFVQTGEEDETPGDSRDLRLRRAMTSGVPVVGPAGEPGGEPGPIAPGLNGLLHPGGDGAGLRTAVAGLAADVDQRRWMGAAARAGVERRTWEVLGDALIGHYRSVLRPTPAAA